MPTGTIKWFNNTMGWGFITPDDGTPDVFIHFSAILNQGQEYKTLFAGQQVQYSAEIRQNGPYATELTPLTRTKKVEKK